ncbi:aspartic peptidase domain-containing protein [Aspergillus bertholletiae]|uniref:Aspartic peptidase domain-containing protein n=1 Tax=Aspergillus bertholletiae TaxID=1226010 RepID=A0A5N7BD24_9EURO|nr:aspartic peptidase domain-containing protein [Aspergillus bertholletiae]
MACKIFLVQNANYRKSGIKSYVHLIRKYRLHPTKNGPYSIGRAIHQTGRPYTNKPIGGRARLVDVMRKQTSDDNFQPVEIDDIQNDAVFSMPVSIGTPVQTLNLVLDTASADFWVRSSELPADVPPPSGEESHTFDSGKSSTFKSIEDSPWKVSYVDGSTVSGSIGIDEITIGEASFKTQPVQLAKTMSPMFTQFSADGVLGLAFGHINHPQQEIKALSERLNTGDGLEQSAKLFTVKYGSWGGSDLKKPFYSFGSIDEDALRYCGHDIHHTPIDNSRGYWMFDSPSTTAGERAINRPENKAVVDTDAALTLLDDQTCQTIYDSIPGAFYDSDSQGFLIPSDINVDQIPVVQLAVGEKSFTMLKESLLFAEAKPGYIYGGIQSRGSLEFDILGGSFLEGLYAIFDFGSLRFGAVQAKIAE